MSDEKRLSQQLLDKQNLDTGGMLIPESVFEEFYARAMELESRLGDAVTKWTSASLELAETKDRLAQAEAKVKRLLRDNVQMAMTGHREARAARIEELELLLNHPMIASTYDDIFHDIQERIEQLKKEGK